MMVKTFVKCYKVYINRNKTAPAPPKAVLNHGHSRAPSQYLHFKAVVDTGCESTIFRGNAGKFLIETSPSNMIVGGFEGDQVIGASIQGIAHCYAISNDPTRPGAYFKHKVDVVDSLNDNLFSIHGLTREQGYTMVLSANPGQQSGLHKKSTPEVPAHVIPVTFNIRKEGFRIELVVAKTRADAIKWGRHEERIKFQTEGKRRGNLGDKHAIGASTLNTGGVEPIMACSTRTIRPTRSNALKCGPQPSHLGNSQGNVGLTN